MDSIASVENSCHTRKKYEKIFFFMHAKGGLGAEPDERGLSESSLSKRYSAAAEECQTSSEMMTDCRMQCC